jgi:hypothetical protein
MRLVIVESPYAASPSRTVADNLSYLRRAMRHCLMQQEAPFASHMLYAASGVFDDDDPDERRIGIEAGLTWAVNAELIAVYCDYGISRGMRLGIEHHAARGLRVVYRFAAPDGMFAESLVLPDAFKHPVL